MIIQCKSGAQIVVAECLWVPGVYLSVGNVKGSMGAIVDPEALARLRAELDRIDAAIAERVAGKQSKKQQGKAA